MKLILESKDLNELGKDLLAKGKLSELNVEHFRVQMSTIYNSDRVTFEDGLRMKVLKSRDSN